MIDSVSIDDDALISDIQNIFSAVYHQKNELKNEFINNPYTKLYVYRDGNAIVGMIHINAIYERYEINNIYVLEEYRNRGIASKLLTKIIEIGREQKIVNITLEVKKTNQAAINLYKKFGFLAKGIRKSYYNGIDGILMEKEMI